MHWSTLRGGGGLKSFDQAFYQLQDNAGIFKQVKPDQLDKIDFTTDAPRMQQPQINDVVSKIGAVPAASQGVIAQAIATAHDQPHINLFVGKKAFEVNKYPWQLFNGDDALIKLGPTLLKTLKTPLDITLFQLGRVQEGHDPGAVQAALLQERLRVQRMCKTSC